MLVASGIALTGMFGIDLSGPSAGLLGPATVAAQEQQETQEQETQEQQETQNAVAPQAGFFGYSGGPVRGKRALTQTAAVNIAAVGAWVTLPTSVPISWPVPAGTSDLFNVAFSAECQKLGGGQARIRILDTATGLPLEPYDGFQVFCSINAPQTHAGLWARRMSGGAHNLVVQFFNSAGSVIIDDWTFEVVVYD
jgi:hypothetical protein